MNISSKRAEHIAITALVLSIIFFAATQILGAFTGFFAVRAIGWHLLSGVMIWFVLVVQFHQRSLAEREKLDMAQLAGGASGETIFHTEQGQADLFADAQKRLGILEKWFVPIFAVLIAAYKVTLGVVLFNVVRGLDGVSANNAALSAVLMVIIAFVSFLFSRYATGMSAEAVWKPLRAGGSSMLASAMLSFAAAICLGFAHFKAFGPLGVLNWVVPILLVALGVEVGLNAVLDIYRPRVKDLYARSAFDSRLLGIINEPGGILHTFASAIDYQFGFNVSQTWFYRLLVKAIVPLIIFSGLTLYSLSCIVIVGPGEEAIIEHLGHFENGGRHVKSGLAFKLPYPFDKVYKRSTEFVHTVNVGFVETEDQKHSRKPLLWGEKHFKEEYKLLVAMKSEGFADDDGTVPVSIVLANVPVHYKIKNLYEYMYNHRDVEKMFEAICYRELVKFAASAKIETDDDADGKKSLLGAGRKEASEILEARIQAAVDANKLGVKIVFLGLQGVHPPSEVAENYEAVVAAIQKKQALILKAQTYRNNVLNTLTGSVKQREALYKLAEDYERVTGEGTAEEIAAMREKLNGLYTQVDGEFFKTLSEAESYAFVRAMLAEAAGARFAGQVKAYRAAPAIYKRILRLAMLEDALQEVRKYVVVADEGDTVIPIIDLQEPSGTDLLGDLDPEMFK